MRFRNSKVNKSYTGSKVGGLIVVLMSRGMGYTGSSYHMAILSKQCKYQEGEWLVSLGAGI
ncbi:MAG: hypothetical protein HWE14_05140 [Flavobacteriia bacterium]|nr:hypothetical protein [Flavobacteriia bacterium]